MQGRSRPAVRSSIDRTAGQVLPYAAAWLRNLVAEGLILATIVNLFLASSAIYWITTYAGVVIFCGLTAYDMQKLKRLNTEGMTGEVRDKSAVLGALALYLDFINLFLFLLRIFGSGR